MARRGLNLPLGKTRKWLRRFLGLSALMAIGYLWLAYVPFVAHKPYCGHFSRYFDSRVDEKYLRKFISLVVYFGVPQDDSFPWENYFLVYDGRVYFTYDDSQSDLVTNSMNRAVRYIGNPNPIIKEVRPKSFEKVRPESFEGRPLLKLYWDWNDVDDAYREIPPSKSRSDRENAWCDLMEAVVTPSPPIDSQNE
jgi:hypothetical protein